MASNTFMDANARLCVYTHILVSYLTSRHRSTQLTLSFGVRHLSQLFVLLPLVINRLLSLN